GFSVILHYWLMVARDPVWLRILPLAIFLAGVLSLGWLGWRWRRSWRFAIFSALVPAAYPLLLDYANEVRAYSMEFTGVVLGCLLLDLFLTKPKLLTSLAGGLVLGVFMTSRYSYVFIATAISLVWLLQIVRQPVSWSRRVAHLLLFLAPAGVAGLGVVFLGFVPQYHARIVYDGGNLVGYLNPFKLGSLSWGDLLKLLAGNIFSPAALPTTVMAAVAWCLLRKSPVPVGASDPWLRSRSVYVMSLAAVLFTAALWKWHPWAVHTKWSSYLHALSAVLVVRLVADLLLVLSQREGRWRMSPPLQEGFLVVAISVFCASFILHRRDLDFDLGRALPYFERHKPKRGTVSVEPHCYPTLRYFYDEGPYSGRPFYPRGFRLPYWNAPTPLIGETTRYFITARRPDRLGTMYPGVNFVSDPKLPQNLLRVEGNPPAPPAAN
ncbi:MAG: hypothetical protein ACAI34_01080, partial [Verrucomicrobium sp.]